MTKLERIGSDHYPMIINLSFEPADNNARELEKTDGEEEEEVEEKIEKGKSEELAKDDKKVE